MGNGKKYVAELIGTFVLVFIGCSAAVIYGASGNYLPIAFAFGLALLTMVYAIGGISGCHINPAVTISMLFAGKITAKNAAVYIIMQCVGAIFGALAVFAVMVGKPGYTLATGGLGQNGFDAASPGGFTLVSGFAAEVLLTFVFVLTIHAVTSKRAPEGIAGIAIGLSLTLVHIVGIPITGTSVNPARSLGPALVLAFVNTTPLLQLWVFWVAPLIGGILAAFVPKLLE
jgi:aquaporin Z